MSEIKVEKEKETASGATSSVTSNRNQLTKAQLHAELEDMVTQLFKNIPLPMHLIYVDKEHRVRYVSEELAKYRGFESAEQVIGLKTTELFPKKGGEAINAVLSAG